MQWAISRQNCFALLQSLVGVGGEEMNDKKNIALISIFLLVYTLEIIFCSRTQIWWTQYSLQSCGVIFSMYLNAVIH